MLKLSNILESNSSVELEDLSYPDMELDKEEDYNKSEKKSKISNLKNDVSDLKSDIKDMQKDLDDLKLDVDDDIGRMTYVRQLTGEFLEYLLTLNNELDTQVEIPQSIELMDKMLGRAERKRYYMSKFRL